MSRLLLRRIAAGALASAAVTAPLLLATPAQAAPAPLPTPVVTPSTFVLGETKTFTVTLSGCSQDTGTRPPGVAFTTDDQDGLGISDASEAVNGGYTFEEPVPDAVPGTYRLLATCDRYSQDQAYPPVTITVVRPSTAAPSRPTAPVPATASPTAPNRQATVTTTNGRTTVTAAPAQSLTPTAPAVPGRAYQLALTGYSPGERTSWTLHSTPRALGTYTADASGTLATSLTIPTDVPAGRHELRVTRADGSVVTYPVEVGGPELAYTGTSIAVPLTLGAGLVGMGAVLLLVTRRRKAVVGRA